MKCGGKEVQKQRIERGDEVKEQPRGKVCNVVKQQFHVQLPHCARFSPWSQWQWKEASVQNRDDLYSSLLTQFQNLIFPLIWMATLCPRGFSKPLAPCSRYWISFLCIFHSNKWLEKLFKILIAVSKHERICIIYKLGSFTALWSPLGC